MPLPFALKWINLWLLEDGEGWTIVDTGVALDESRTHWRAIFASPALKGKPVTRVIVTHMHPDHIGLAGWITRKFQCRLWITRLEYTTCRMLVADTGREALDEGERFFRAAGWNEDQLDSYRVRFGGFGKGVSRLPDAYRRLEDGDAVEIGAHTWRVITGCGHSPEHACLYNEALNILISGDQLLPRISSNVSVFPTEPEADPLTDWLRSCAKLKVNIPGDVLVLPAHNEPFTGAHARLDDLINGHERALSRLEQRLAEPKRAVDLFGAIFARKIDDDLIGMATGETIAHLNCLIGRGRVRAASGPDGATLYERA
ncbi:MAG: MBL fold metallo-hydrolase [Alphaproteobacteria bacterium]|nr:MBL fold metallo-hydrolase [Alphaproteobacteria bacterium]